MTFVGLGDLAKRKPGDLHMTSGKRRSYLGKRGYIGYHTRVELVREGSELYEPVTISRPKDAYDFLKNVRNSDRESLYSIMLDAGNHVVGCEEVSRGSLNTTRTHPREIYKSAILSSALGILLAHNHPSGILDPSPEDIEFTQAVARAGEIVGIELYDHVIVTDRGYTSLRERGLL